MTNNPGAYALLVGSGASISAGVPSAWGIQEDLIRQVHMLEVPAPNVEDYFAWYADRYGQAPTYDGLLGRLASTQSERQSLLRPYFEPSEQDRANGTKLPTEAHRAIARLVQGGIVRIVLTLNFDRLIETAIRDLGIEPTVVSQASDIDGLNPLHSQTCLVVHLHGDYLSPHGMLNTAEELGSYPDNVQALLRQVLTEYGLVIAGWSAEWDSALRDAIKENPCRFYSTWWIDPSPLGILASEIRAARTAAYVEGSAEAVIGRLADDCEAIETLRYRNPLTAAVLVANAKRALAGGAVSIPLHDTLREEMSRLETHPALAGTEPQPGPLWRIGQLTAAIEPAAALVATLAYWGHDSTDSWWIGDVARLGRGWTQSGALDDWYPRYFPSCALLYAAGASATAAGRFDLVRRLLTEPRTKVSDRSGSIARILTPEDTMRSRSASRVLYDLVSPILSQRLALGSSAAEEAWQRFTYLLLAQVTLESCAESGLDDALFEADMELSRTEEAAKYQAATGPSRENADAAVARSTEDRHARLHTVATHVPSSFHHLLMAGRANAYHPVVGQHLKEEVQRQGERHPLLAAGLFRGYPGIAISMFDATDVALSDLATQVVWARTNSSIVAPRPTGFWLDEVHAASFRS